MTSRMLKYFLIAGMFLVATAVQAASVIPLGLERLLGDASVVFYGRCISNQVEQDVTSGMVVTYTTFEVIDPIVGVVGDTHTIKQIGGELPGNNIQMNWPGIPKFIEGEELVIFLPPKSSKGFSSPIGLGQGKFTLSGNAATGREVTNGRNVQDLIQNIPGDIVPASVLNQTMTKSTGTKSDTKTKYGAKPISINKDGSEQTKIQLDDFLTILRRMKEPK